MSNLDHVATVEHIKDLYLQHTATIERLQAVNNTLFFGRSLPDERRDELKTQLAELDEKAADLDRQIKEATPAAEAAADALRASGEYAGMFFADSSSGVPHQEVSAEEKTRMDEITAEAVERNIGVKTVADVAEPAVSAAEKAEPVVKDAPVTASAVNVEPVASTGGYSTPGYRTPGYSAATYSTVAYDVDDEDDDFDSYADENEDNDVHASGLSL